mmetsp:Transcript_41955/g.125599  ORF Transcript_41955/g.125599 Transcript_41955/m.125599 type:complete len:256 (-) Transcript_41955:682-1449(-)
MLLTSARARSGSGLIARGLPTWVLVSSDGNECSRLCLASKYCQLLLDGVLNDHLCEFHAVWPLKSTLPLSRIQQHFPSLLVTLRACVLVVVQTLLVHVHCVWRQVLCEPRMLLDLRHRDTLCGILGKKLHQQIAALWRDRDVVRDFELVVDNGRHHSRALVLSWPCLSKERVFAKQHYVQHDAARPDVCRLAIIVARRQDDLGRDVTGRADFRLGQRLVDSLGVPEIADFDQQHLIGHGLQQRVLQLHVAVHDAL